MIFTAALVFFGYYLGARIGFALTFRPHPVSVMWPPNSILLAALLLNPTRRWWVLFAAALPAHLIVELQQAVPLGMTLSWFLSNSSEALIGAACTRYLLGASSRIDNLRSMGGLFLCAGLIGPFLSSFLDAGLVSLNQFGDHEYWHVRRMRFCSNVFTAMALVPFIVTWGQHAFRQQGQTRWSHRLEVGAVYLALLSISVVVFNWQMNGPATITALLYLPMPLMLWTAVRFAPTGTSTAILTCALLAIGGAVHGRGPFV